MKLINFTEKEERLNRTINDLLQIKILKEIRFFLFLFVFLMGSACFCSEGVSATSDTTGPTVANMTVTPDTVDMGDYVTVSAEISDTSGVADGVSVQICSSAGNVAGGLLTLISGDTNSGIYQGKFQIPTGYSAGQWNVTIYAKDVYGNFCGFATAYFTVNGYEDTTGPTVANVTVTPDTVDMGGYVTVSAEISDASGVADGVSVQICSSAGNVAGGLLTLISGDTNSGIYQGEFQIPTRYSAGQWNATIYARDVYGNFCGFATAYFTVNEHIHDWNSEYTIDKEATYYEEGLQSIHCSICNQIKEGSQKTIPPKGQAEPSVKDSGTCGNNLVWKLDDKGVLTISGDGGMQNPTWSSHNSDIKHIVIEEGVTSICSEAFMKCCAEDIIIPSSVQNIYEDAFRFCDSLKRVDIDKENAKYSSRDGIIYNKNYTMMYFVPTNIQLKVLDIPDTVVSFAWKDDNPIAVPIAGKCTNIEAVIIPESLKRDPFDLMVYSFLDSPNIQSIEVNQANESYASIDGVLYDKDIKTLVWYPPAKKDEVFFAPESVEVTENFGASGVGQAYLRNISFPAGITSCMGITSCNKLENIYLYCSKVPQIGTLESSAALTAKVHVLKDADEYETAFFWQKCGIVRDLVPEGWTTHEWNETYTVDKEATCTAEGSESIHCSVCDAIKEGSDRIINKKEHDWNKEYTTDKEASYTEKGMKSIHCSVCDQIKDGSQKVIPALEKMANPMAVKVTKKIVKVKTVAKKAQVVVPITASKAKGIVTYRIVGGNAKSKKALTINSKTGKVTVKKKTAKGTYKVQVKVTAAGTSTGSPQYKAGSKTVWATVKVQ